MESSRQGIAYSVVIPAHNEAENLPRLLVELEFVMDGLGEPYELIAVDDGSTDGTAQLLDDWQTRMPQLRALRLDANYGQSAAFDAGFRAAAGAIIITLDADGQNPPSEIPRLLASLGDADLVCGWRQGRQDHWTKRLASKFANTLRRKILGDGIHDTGCSLKAFRRHVVQRIKLFHGMHRFLPALAQMEGFRAAEVRVAHAPRERGRSHYGILDRALGPLIDLLVVYWMRQRCRRWRVVPEGLRGRDSARAVVGGSTFRVASGVVESAEGANPDGSHSGPPDSTLVIGTEIAMPAITA
jgi:glycosyltransferase involved in cell wall biosynthesis